MRDIALFIVVFGMLPFILQHAYLGVLAWSWLSYMNPHRLTWGPAFDFPFAQTVAITLLVSLLFDREKKKFPFTPLTITWIVFILWTLITTAFAIYPERAWVYETQVLKIQLILFISLWMMGDEKRIRLMVWVIFFSIGFFGIKGGIFTLMTGGAGRVWGPSGSFIGDNNHLAVALLMVLPLGFYIYKYEVEKKAYKAALLFCALMITASVIGSFSRGAFLAIGAVAFYLWLKTPGKIISGTIGTIVLILIVMVMPQHWSDRMKSIGDYEQDASALTRLNAWHFAFNLANSRFIGGGYRANSRETYAQWAPDPNDRAVAHSIYFSVLQDHGWVGLGLFLLVFGQGWLIAGRITRQVKTRGSPQEKWMGDLAKMIKVSFVAYAVGGAFLNLAYFDLPWHLVAIIVLLDQRVKRLGSTGNKALESQNVNNNQLGLGR